eukprot:gene6809-35485_t
MEEMEVPRLRVLISAGTELPKAVYELLPKIQGRTMPLIRELGTGKFHPKPQLPRLLRTLRGLRATIQSNEFPLTRKLMMKHCTGVLNKAGVKRQAKLSDIVPLEDMVRKMRATMLHKFDFYLNGSKKEVLRQARVLDPEQAATMDLDRVEEY